MSVKAAQHVACRRSISLGAGAAHAAKDLVIALRPISSGLDPADLNDNLSQSAARMMFQGLYMLDKDMKLMPGLAESYEANEEATEFIFHLRHGVTFQDGTPFNAQAVKFSFDRAGNPDNHLKRQSLFVMIDHTDVVDDYTVKTDAEVSVRRVHQRPRTSGRADRHRRRRCSSMARSSTRHPVGTGPYKFVTWQRRYAQAEEERALLEAGPAEGRQHHLSSVPENGAGWRCCRPGRRSSSTRCRPRWRVAEEQPDDHSVRRASILARYVALNNMRKPFDDPRVRQALNYAVDKQAFIKVVFNGHAEPMDSPMPPLLGFYQGRAPIRTIRRRPRRCWPRRAIRTDSRSTLTGGAATLVAARHAVPAAATRRRGGEGEGGAAGGRCADGEGCST